MVGRPTTYGSGGGSSPSASSGGGFAAAQGWMAASGIAGALGAYQGGRIARTVGRMRKRIAQDQAKQVVASAQRQALNEKKNAELIASRAIAVAAAGGGGADDITVTNIVADIDAEGAYRAAVAMYEAETEAANLRYQGELSEWEGNQAYKAGKVKAVGSLLETGARIFAYG